MSARSGTPLCDAKLADGRACLRAAGHWQGHFYRGIEGENCTCMLRWYPNRCTAHPEANQ